MPKGKAKCKECGRLVIEKVEKDIKCSGCGRIFQIPNEPQYTNPIRNHSLARLGLGLGLIDLLDTEYPQYSTNISGKWEALQEVTHQNFQVRLSSFPKRNDPVLLRKKDELKVIVEFYSHKLSDIGITVDDDNLILQSNLPLCSYQNTIALPKGFDTISKATLKNGILEVSLNLPFGG